ncbi:protein FAR-RED IMPAIRED RESPONSE 1-like [Abrus precatorius]|uniref:Protein FAR-RED IMPAIRED RESPONSE 1-like n=1 Tax=Abrus precatorius TaxID=3816 RepID=A0A8B8L4M7_ABRPR|nr:protein FAR-RED IMPAIRED RESPONSE 1-like [Abrus precatorius]
MMHVRLHRPSSKWKVVTFKKAHNHELTPLKFIHMMPKYRGMSDGDKAQIDNLQLHGVRTCNIMGLMMGGHAGVGFLKKDLYHHIDKKKGRVKDRYAVTALSYLQSKAENDPLCFFKHTKTVDERLKHLFWSDRGSCFDYQVFGDVIAFDSTYKKHKYNKPLVIFCGYNHHEQTTIFGCALVLDETIETYKWVLKSFSKVMFSKHPNAIVTDGDGAMQEAIKVVFPNCSH